MNKCEINHGTPSHKGALNGARSEQWNWVCIDGVHILFESNNWVNGVLIAAAVGTKQGVGLIAYVVHGWVIEVVRNAVSRHTGGFEVWVYSAKFFTAEVILGAAHD